MRMVVDASVAAHTVKREGKEWMRAYIVTGTTRGIGRAIAEAVIERKDRLLSLSRAPDQASRLWNNISCDLRETEEIRTQLDRLMRTVSLDRFSDLVLINNAGVLAPMGPMAEADDGKIVENLIINQAAPAILMSAFIGLTAGFNGSRRIINISSGAAGHPYAGWALYCASKSALDMMTLCAAAEQAGKSNPVKICAVYPGKVETDMQQAVRRADPEKFPAQPKFVMAKAQGDVLTASQAARAIISMDVHGAFRNGCIYDIRSTMSRGETDVIKPIRSLPLDD